MATLTVYPDPGVGGTTTCGIPRATTGNLSWANLIINAGTAVQTSADSAIIVSFESGDAANTFDQLRRSIYTFDTSALTSGATISGAVFSLFGTAKDDSLAASPNIDVYTASPASNGTIVAADFTQIGSTSQTGAPISFASWSTTAYNDFTFNGTGIGNISKTGISKFGVRNANCDVAGVAPHFITGFVSSSFTGSFADHTGTSQDPKLVITYSLSGNTSSVTDQFMLLGVG